jgi:hypothetical protein
VQKEKARDLEREILDLQTSPISQQDFSKEQHLVTKYEQTTTKLNDFYVQRAKKSWAKDGDRNAAFFHRVVARRRRRNSIVSVKDEQNITQFMPDQIENTFVLYFRSIFASQSTHIAASRIPTYPPQTSDFTDSIPTKEEIWETLKGMKRNASPGPDGFNVEFYLATWDWIGDDVLAIITNFFNTGILPPQSNKTHIALIPKKLISQVPADYRPISLCNVIYKIITKCLANRLKPHLPDHIHPSQQAFIEGRRISDNIIIAQEITHSFQLSS